MKVAGPVDEKAELRFLIADLTANIVPAIRQRLNGLRKQLDGNSARRLLEKARKAGRRAIRKRDRARKKTKKPQDKKAASRAEGDWLLFILATRVDRNTWRDLARLYGMLRMLEAVGSVDAARLMIDCYSYFGELVRIDLQRAIARMRDKAVAALLEAKQHDARKVRRWARRRLNELGRAIPGEAVSTTDAVVLADVLLAFGRIRELDATRVILSYTNSERVQLRTAARQALSGIGEAASWHLKDVYKNLTGKKAPRSWDWRRTARELFRIHDRARLAKVYALWRDGSSHSAKKRHAEAARAFDKLLARVPLFSEREKMAPAYHGYGRLLLAEGKDREATTALRKALRLAPVSDKKNIAKIASLLAYLEGKALAEAGTPDRFILERALTLDSSNEAARKLLASLKDASAKRQSHLQRRWLAGAVGVVVLILLILLARRPKRRSVEPKDQETDESAESVAAEPDSGVQPSANESDVDVGTPDSQSKQ